MKAWAARDQHSLRGLTLLEPLEWDSQVLGMSAARLEIVASTGASAETVARLIDAAIASASQHGIRHLSARVDAADDPAVHALEVRGFLNVDALLTFAASPADLARAPAPGEATTRTASQGDSETIAALAGRAFTHGRFHSDPAITAARATAVYSTWAAACCEGSAADAVIVVETGETLAGFVACRMQHDTAVYLNRPTGTIPLIATSDYHRGQGIGAALVAAAGRWFGSQDAVAVEIGTQLRNVPAARLYERCGFRLVGGSLSFRLMVTP